ncbi:MAG: glycine cleavage system aminomethyltransferase GcvT [Pirellulales bacterium]|nr:glycine cleavage system aminomethyltransferase GcvT [Pirellulales bacterium]
MTGSLARTPLYDWHQAHGGRLVDFAGWEMPVSYSSIVAEHTATRTAVGLFDISHMGRLQLTGADAETALERIVTRRIAGLATGQVVYSLVTNDAGGILDDILVYKLADASGSPYFLVVVNASNRDKIVAWFEKQLTAEKQSNPRLDVAMVDRTPEWGMIAVQGPKALELVRPFLSVDPSALRYYHAAEARIGGPPGIVSRTGYTGEDGVELIVGASGLYALWETLLMQGRALGALPAGLGCRDTLRLEAAMPLYGHELNEQINPFQAGLSFAVDLEKQFPGRDALVAAKANTDRPVRIGLVLDGKRVPREGFDILESAAAREVASAAAVGQVTSGTFSPTLERPIAMGYVDRAVAAPGTTLAIDIRGRAEPATVVKLPFYRRTERKQA